MDLPLVQEGWKTRRNFSGKKGLLNFNWDYLGVYFPGEANFWGQTFKEGENFYFERQFWQIGGKIIFFYTIIWSKGGNFGHKGD